MFLRFVLTVEHGCNLFIFTADNNLLNKYNLFVHPTIDGHMCGLWFGALKNSFAVYNNLEKVSWYTLTFSLEYLLRCKIAVIPLLDLLLY